LLANESKIKCVADTSPFIWLDSIGQTDIIFKIYGVVYTTPEVKKEDSIRYLSSLLGKNFRNPYVKDLIARLSA
jgi:hypothetical protein